jgi:hypothetical protein
MSSMFSRSKDSLAVASPATTNKDAPTTLEKSLDAYSTALDKLTAQLSKEIDLYRGIVARNQFNVLTLEQIFDWAPAGLATITLTSRINQLCVFDRLFYTVPIGTTSLIITIGRDIIPLFFTTGASLNNTLPIQFILGGADKITGVVTPSPTTQWAFGLFGRKTGNTQEI